MRSTEQRTFVVQGKIPGAVDDTVAEVVINGDGSPSDVFIESVLYGGNMPKDWKDRPPTALENQYGEWAYVHSVAEVSCPGRSGSLSSILDRLASIPPHNPERFKTVDGLDNPKCTNGMRAGFATTALIAFQTTCHMAEEVDVATSDLICGLLHLVHASGYNPKTVLEAATEHFLMEAGEV